MNRGNQMIAIWLMITTALGLSIWSYTHIPDEPTKAAVTTTVYPSIAGVQASSGGITASDPYDTYRELVGPDAPVISREDAQARAIAGCATEWAPGTVDAALQEAYDSVIQEYRDQGWCP